MEEGKTGSRGIHKEAVIQVTYDDDLYQGDGGGDGERREDAR